MVTVMWSLIIALWAEHGLGGACNTTTSPIALPITDTVVDPKIPDSLMRGIPAKIGTPSHNIVVLPWTDLNNTYIYDKEAYCDPSIIWNDKICEIRRGGYFLEDKSTSFTKSSDLAAAGSATQELGTRGAELGVPELLSTSFAGTELFAAGTSNSTAMLIGIPRMRWDNGYTILHAVGLGSNSTYLNALFRSGQIPSRVWSMFWGRMWTGNAATDMDGSLVLGGYDQEKVIGRNVTQPLDYSEDTGCWTGMKVTVSNVVVNFRNGTDYGIMPRNSAVPCCIVPQRQLVWEGPVDIVDAFETATQMNSTGQSFGLHWGARQYTASGNIFDGDVTFVLSNVLQIRIPNNQLITPFVEVDRNGSRLVHQDRKEPLMGGVSDNPTTLGRYFFTGAYLMVDHDAQTFTMWQANPSAKNNLVPVVSKLADNRENECGVDGGATSGPGGANESGSTSENAVGTSSISAGAIAGAAVGAVAVLGGLAGLIFFLLRRKKRKGMMSSGPPLADTSGVNQGSADEVHYKTDQSERREVPGSECSPRELHGTPAFSQGDGAYTNWKTSRRSGVTYELDGTGMPPGYIT
ncbi:aspartic peptidase domain-containing protein [Achaetomium macrosporum]|uniref:Aspartic peptidase domain-containing protein n=1 Tax=Achaetomium macrosporum TaxID=79813 RepID=A0AAN7C350_9PEZI|nr:aspartic peptidase domain-containing protein [Achaetomium macrosporum]